MCEKPKCTWLIWKSLTVNSRSAVSSLSLPALFNWSSLVSFGLNKLLYTYVLKSYVMSLQIYLYNIFFGNDYFVCYHCWSSSTIFQRVGFSAISRLCQSKFLCLFISAKHFITVKKKKPCLEQLSQPTFQRPPDTAVIGWTGHFTLLCICCFTCELTALRGKMRLANPLTWLRVFFVEWDFRQS